MIAEDFAVLVELVVREANDKFFRRCDVLLINEIKKIFKMVKGIKRTSRKYNFKECIKHKSDISISNMHQYFLLANKINP